MPGSSEPDLYRDTPIRLLGYANELAEAFRPIIHRYTVYSGYVLATGYMLADVADKSYKASKTNEDKKKWVMTALDVMLWQGLASLIVPSMVINRFSAASRFAMAKTTKLGNKRINFISVVLSVGLIPFIVKPIDNSVDYFMDNYARPVLGTNKKKDD